MKIMDKIKKLFNKKWLKKHKFWLLGLCALVVIGVIVLIIVHTAQPNIADALDSSAKIYDNVTVTIRQTQVDLTLAAQSELTDTDTTDSTDETAEAEETTAATEAAGTTEATEALSITGDTSTGYTNVFVTTISKDGNRYYEESDSSKCYFYPKDGTTYAMYYDDMLDISSGRWVEVEAQSNNLEPVFDLTILDRIDSEMLEKVDDVYVPIDIDSVFYTLFDTDFRSYYKSRYICFKFDGNQLESITANYVFDGKYQIVEEYTFTYGEAAVTIPGLNAAND